MWCIIIVWCILRESIKFQYLKTELFWPKSETPNNTGWIFISKHLHFYKEDVCSFLWEIITMRQCSLHNIYYSSRENCKHHEPVFLLPGFWKLYKVCQLPGWTVLRVSMSPRCARRGWHARVEIRRWEESVPAMPQKLHSRVRALFSSTWELALDFSCGANICLS